MADMRSLGEILQRAGAGFQGNLAQFDATRAQQQMMTEDRERVRRAEAKALSQERVAAAAQDAQIALQFLETGAVDKALELVDNRLGFIKQFQGDPSDTQAVRDLIAKGDIDTAKSELKLFTTEAEARGLIKPMAQPEPLSNFGKQAYDEGWRPGSPQFAARVKELSAPEDKGAVSPFGKVEEDFKAGRIDRATYDALKRKETAVDGKEPDTFGNSAKLRGEFDTKTKDFSVVRDAYSKMASVAKEPSAAGDISLIFGFMKLNDPNSTVREGEFATAQNAGSINERVRARYNAALNGETLTAQQRADFMKQAGNIYGSQEGQFRKEVERYSGLAKKFGVDPETVTYDRAEGVTRVTVGTTPDGKPVYEIDGKMYVDTQE